MTKSGPHIKGTMTKRKQLKDFLLIEDGRFDKYYVLKNTICELIIKILDRHHGNYFEYYEEGYNRVDYRTLWRALEDVIEEYNEEA